MAYTLLICNGEMSDAGSARTLAEGASRIVCADGGADAAWSVGIVPHVVIGDFDSITAETRASCERAGAEFIHRPTQDRTDFEKALTYIMESGERRVMILGLTGKLIDHTLGNFSTLMRYCREMEMTAFDREYRIDVVSRSRTFRSAPGDRISILPLIVAKGLTSSGLQYPLRNSILSFGSSEGTSNRALGDSFTLRMETGAVVVFRVLHPELWQEEI